MSTPTEEAANEFFEASKPEPLSEAAEFRHVVISPTNDVLTHTNDRSKGKKRVGFTGEDIVPSGSGHEDSWGDYLRDGTLSPHFSGSNCISPSSSGDNSPYGHRRESSGDLFIPNVISKSHLPELSRQQTEQLRGAISRGLEISRPRPAIRRGSLSRDLQKNGDDFDRDGFRDRSARQAHEQAKRHEELGQLGFPASESGQGLSGHDRNSITSFEDIQLRKLRLEGEFEDENGRITRPSHIEASRLLRRHTLARDADHGESEDQPGLRSGYDTPIEELEYAEDYESKPERYRGGVLGTLLSLYGQYSRNHSRDQSACSTPARSPLSSGANTPTGRRQRWYSHKSGGHSSSSLATLVGISSTFGSPALSELGEQVSKKLVEQKEQAKRPRLGKRTKSALKRLSRARPQEDFKIKAHIEETMDRQKYLLKLCRALMQYGAPTHRLEEYLTMSARVLETEAQFLYLPGAMIVSFEDWVTHTSELRLIKEAHGLDLGKLREAHEIYKEVIQDKVSVNNALGRLKELSKRQPKHSRVYRLLVYGLAAVCVGPFAFGARALDLPVAFVLGCILGALHLYAAPKSPLYANLFEVGAAFATSFFARFLGSLRHGELFCFSALAQSSIALILPGYTITCAALELQSRSIIAGSVRMVYAIIYSLFLGYGITIGTTLYGSIDKHATSATTCTNSIPQYWNFLFVPGFTMCLIVINQAKWTQAPLMMVISLAGYAVNFFMGKLLAGNTQVSNTLAAFTIGLLANGHSRLGPKVERYWWKFSKAFTQARRNWFHKRRFSHSGDMPSAKSIEEANGAENDEPISRKARRKGAYGLAAAAMLPAIFVQVPSGIAVNGSLVSGVASANQITGSDTSGNGTTVANITNLGTADEGLNSIAFTVGFSMVQIAIGITVGLFASAVCVYPRGKKRSGMFSL